jgi:carbamoyltransferase
LILGLNISHDASASLTTDDGVALYSIGEERISRVKNHIGVPRKSIQAILECVDTSQVNKIIIGGQSELTRSTAIRIATDLRNIPSNPEGTWKRPSPGFNQIWDSDLRNPKSIIEDLITNLLPDNLKDINMFWENHHDSHIACAMATSQNENRILVSLDGEGDGESGAVSLQHSGKIENLLRIPAIDSLGNLYSAVTERYNFSPGKHEGKITGLAAFGKHSAAIDILRQHVSVVNGRPKITCVKTLKDKFFHLVFKELGYSNRNFRTLDQIVDLASSKTTSYSDLAYAIQFILEESVIEIIDFWVRKTQVADISLAGGVFANVKLNQRISESKNILNVNVFPNMGDGGIALGGIWSHLGKNNALSRESLYQTMYLAPIDSSDDQLKIQSLKNDKQLTHEKLSLSTFSQVIARDITQGKLVAIHNGPMEFGPRALGNRSLLLDPRRPEIVKLANDRLKRTEFMPFAPVIKEDYFFEYFNISSNQSLQPFYYMTMTCNVNKEMEALVPAVVHVDGTARPQITNIDINPYLYEILDEFHKLTGIPLLVNTSLNVHEEPINCSISDTVKAVKSGHIDVAYFGEVKIELNK